MQACISFIWWEDLNLFKCPGSFKWSFILVVMFCTKTKCQWVRKAEDMWTCQVWTPPMRKSVCLSVWVWEVCFFPCSKVTAYLESWADVFHVEKYWRCHFLAVLSWELKLERDDLFPPIKFLGLLTEIVLLLTGDWNTYATCGWHNDKTTHTCVIHFSNHTKILSKPPKSYL